MAGSVLPHGFRRERHESVSSTNALALQRAQGGDPGRLWITAGEQTAGHGRRGRSWTTGYGNLAASLLLVDPAPPEVAPTVSFVAGLALHEAVIDLAGPSAVDRLRLKWPNDLILDGRKVSGILVEGGKSESVFALAIGIGVNCVSHPETTAGTYPPGDLRAAGLDIAAEDLFDRLAANFAAELAIWDRGGGFPQIRSAWLDRALGIGEAIVVNLPDRVLGGRFDSLDEDGRLILEIEGGDRLTISAGELFLG